MAEFLEVMRQAQRMCDTYDCDHCPLTYESVLCALASDKDLTCSVIKKFESKVMQWAKEHSEPQYPTWKEWQEENFPDIGSKLKPCNFMMAGKWLNIIGGSCDCLTCDDCIRQPIPADIAKKLGIRPKEA